MGTKSDLHRHISGVHEKNNLYPFEENDPLASTENSQENTKNMNHCEIEIKTELTEMDSISEEDIIDTELLPNEDDKLILDKSDKKPFILECSICNITFGIQRKKFRKHVEEVHDGIRLKPKCAICNNTFFNTSSLKDHILAVHEKKKPFKCPMCDLCCSQKGSLQKHIETVHEDQKRFLCSLCTYRSSTKGDLKTHTETVHERKKRHKCSLCDSQFYKPYELKQHIGAVHEGKRPYSCTECGDSFKYSQHLRRHFARVHEGKKPSAHVHFCDLCDRSFKTKVHLKRHISKVHDEDEIEPYKCSF